jgi:hypothetical protein
MNISFENRFIASGIGLRTGFWRTVGMKPRRTLPANYCFNSRTGISSFCGASLRLLCYFGL